MIPIANEISSLWKIGTKLKEIGSTRRVTVKGWILCTNRSMCGDCRSWNMEFLVRDGTRFCPMGDKELAWRIV